MCFAGAQFIPGVVQGVTSGLNSLSTARYQAAAAKNEGRQAQLGAEIKAQQLERKGAQDLSAMRRTLLGAGNVSALDFVGDEATALAQNVAITKHGGEIARAEAKARAAMELRQGRLGLATGLLSATGDAIRSSQELVSAWPKIWG